MRDVSNSSGCRAMEDDLTAFFLSITGVGPAKARLLREAGFTTFDALRRAKVEELARVPGIGYNLAKKIKEALEAKLPEEKKSEIYLCPLCGAFVGKDARQCPHCGTIIEGEEEIEEAPKQKEKREEDGFWYKERANLYLCPICGSFVGKDAKECPHCGAIIEEGEEEEKVTTEEEVPDFWYKEEERHLYLCPVCGAFMGAEAKECPHCHAVVEGEEEEEEEIGEEEAIDYWYKSGEEAEEKLRAFFGAEEGLPERREPEEGGEIVICPACGALNPPTAEKCTICGASLLIEELELPEEEIPEEELLPGAEAEATEIEETTMPPIEAKKREYEEQVERMVEEATREKMEEKRRLLGDFMRRWKRIEGEEEVSDEAKIKSALREYEKLIEADPTIPKVWQIKGELLAKLGRWQEAIECFDRAAELNPEMEGEYRAEVLSLLAEKFDPEKERIEWRRWSVPKGAEAEEIERRLRYYDYLLEAHPQMEKAWQAKGQLLAKLGRYEEALECFDKAIELNDREGTARRMREAILSKKAVKEPALSTVGLVNGLRPDRGLVNGLTNGTLRRGRINGLINGLGRINGLLRGRGRINGLINGLGRVNGLVNGKGFINGRGLYIPEGRINGRGLVNGMGLINGIGFINGRGLINGIGLVNGAGRFYHPVERRVPPAWGRNTVLVALIASMVLVVPVLLTLIYMPLPASAISIDGKFSDWAEIPPIRDALLDEQENLDINFAEFKIAEEGRYLSFYARVLGILYNGTESGADEYYVFLDIDNNSRTGYLIQGMGADYCLKTFGWEGKMRAAYLYRFNDSRPHHDFSGFNYKKKWKVGYNESCFEFQIIKSSIHLEMKKHPRVLFVAKDDIGRVDRSDFILPSDGGGTLRVVQSTLSKRVVQRGESTAILRFSMKTGRQDVVVRGMRLKCVGDKNALGSLVLYEDTDMSGNFTLNDRMLGAARNLSQPKADINLHIRLPSRAVRTWFLVGNVSSNTNTSSALGYQLETVDDVLVERGAVTLLSELTGNVYVESIPSTIVIDGAFADWDAQLKNRDGNGDVNGTQNLNIDLNEYSVALDEEHVSFYARVNGIMMGGADIPTKVKKPLPLIIDSDHDGIPDEDEPGFEHDFDNDGVPDDIDKDKDNDFLLDYDCNGTDIWLVNEETGAKWYIGPTYPKDSDHDGIPDEDEPGFEHDFNNDGIADNETNDRDGDGVDDWPMGDDIWLENMDTGAVFYVGPSLSAPHIKTGEDRLWIFLDADKNNYTGYAVPMGRIGAEYLIEVKGRGGEITSSTLYRFNTSLPFPRSSWVWCFVADIPAAKDKTRIELQIDASYLPNGADVFFYTTDWENAFDGSDRNVRITDMGLASSRSDIETKSLHLRAGNELSTFMGDIDTSINVNKGGTVSWLQTPVFAADFSLDGDIVVHLYAAQDEKRAGITTVTLSYDGVTIGSATQVVDSGNTIQEYIYRITPSVTTIPAGSAITLTYSSERKTVVWFNSPTYDSRIDMSTTTYVDVVNITLLNGTTYNQQYSFVSGETFNILANITDPFGSQDIWGANVTVYYPNGSVMVSETPMSLDETDPSTPSLWKIFNYTVSLPADAPSGTYEIAVKGIESNWVIDVEYAYFDILSNQPAVSIYPDHLKSATPGTTVEFTHTVKNLNMVSSDTLDLTAFSAQGWVVELFREDGATPLVDTDNDGMVDTGSLGPGEKLDIVVKVYIPENTSPGTTDKTTVTVYSSLDTNVTAWANDTTRVVASTPEGKTLHLHAGNTMDTFQGTASTSVAVGRGGSTSWTQTLVFASDFSLDSDITVTIYAAQDENRAGDATVTLSYGSTVVGSATQVIDGGTGVQAYVFTINPLVNTIPKGEALTLTYTSERKTVVWFDSATYDSRLDVDTTTYVNVVNVTILNGTTYSEQYTFVEGDTVLIRANVTDPFGTQDIWGANVTVYAPDGSVVVPTTPMTLEATDPSTPSFYKIYNYSFTLPIGSQTGVYRVVVEGIESNWVISTTESYFSILQPAPGVSIYPDHMTSDTAGSVVSYRHTVKNLNSMNSDVFDITYFSNQGWNVQLFKSDGITPLPDTDGDGTPDTGLLSPGEAVDIVVKVSIPFNAAVGTIDTTIINATSSLNNTVSDSTTDTTTVVLAKPETKTLHLHNGNTLDTFGGTSATSTDVDRGGTVSWTQTPPFAMAFGLDGELVVTLYAAQNEGRAGDATVTLTYDGTTIGSATVPIDRGNTIQPYTFVITPSVTSIPDGQSITLIYTSEKRTTIWYDSSLYDSRIDMTTTTYVNVDMVSTHNATTVLPQSTFSAGEEVLIWANVSDPFGSQDISGANIILLYPNGTVYKEASMTLQITDPASPSAWKLFNYSFIIEDTAPVGTYTVKVEGVESNGVIDLTQTTFQVPGGVTVEPDHTSYQVPGVNVTYDHWINNTGKGADRFTISVQSSQGWNISIYDASTGQKIATDIDGDGVWDWVNPAYDSNNDGKPDTGILKKGESFAITVEIEIPSDAPLTAVDVTIVTAASQKSSVSDSATDTTIIPEFDGFTLPLGCVLCLLLILLRKRKKE